MENDELIKRAEDLLRRSDKTSTVTHTAFLTPAEQAAIEKWARYAPDCIMILRGGHPDCERRAAFFLPYYMEAESFDESEYISALKAETRFGAPTHRDYMGAVLALGIKREWLGDIWISGESAVIFLMQSVERHVLDGLEKVGRFGVKLSPAPLDTLEAPERHFKRVSFSVKSLRFDAVLSDMFGISRTAAVEHIAREEASLNYEICRKNDAAVAEGDVISLRGRGKGKIVSAGGTSRRGRIFVEAEIYK